MTPILTLTLSTYQSIPVVVPQQQGPVVQGGPRQVHDKGVRTEGRRAQGTEVIAETQLVGGRKDSVTLGWPCGRTGREEMVGQKRDFVLGGKM